MKLLMIRKLLTIPFLLVLLPLLTLANGGDQRIVENKYFINLSRAPFTPRVGVKDSMLASFFDIQANRLIAEDLFIRIRISKFGGTGSASRTFIFEEDNVKVQGGVLEFPYTFSEAGLHEIYFDFAFASNPEKVYEVPDFLIDVQKPLEGYNTNQILIVAFAGFVIGLLAGWFAKRR